jgi:hypothetical protein
MDLDLLLVKESDIQWLACLHLWGKIFNYSIINIHSQTEVSLDEEKYNFYDVLEKTWNPS